MTLEELENSFSDILFCDSYNPIVITYASNLASNYSIEDMIERCKEEKEIILLKIFDEMIVDEIEQEIFFNTFNSAKKKDAKIIILVEKSLIPRMQGRNIARIRNGITIELGEGK